MGISKRIEQSRGLENRVTEQAGKETQDINNMAKRAFRNRLKGDPNGRTPIFGEVSSLTFHEQMNMVTDVQNRFSHLAPRIRRRFHDNPYLLLKFVENPQNAREAVKMGLLIDEEGIFDEKETEPPTPSKQGSGEAPPPPRWLPARGILGRNCGPGSKSPEAAKEGLKKPWHTKSLDVSVPSDTNSGRTGEGRAEKSRLVEGGLFLGGPLLICC